MKARIYLRGTATQRFIGKLAFDGGSDGCWIWTAHRNRKGYGRFKVATGQLALTHRFSYERFLGDIPDGFTVDHLCGNRACANPAHLEAVPHAVNVGRSGPATKTHCKRGHPLFGPNLYRPPAGGRCCRVCIRAATIRWEERTGRRATNRRVENKSARCHRQLHQEAA